MTSHSPSIDGAGAIMRTSTHLAQLVAHARSAVVADGREPTRRPEVASILNDLERYASRIPGGVDELAMVHLHEAHALFVRHPHGAVDDVLRCLSAALEHLA